MSDFDLDRLGDVWRQQPDPAEMERLQRTAIAVARRARLSAILDICAAVAVGAVVVFLVVTNPQPKTLVLGSGAIVVLLISNIRQRKLRKLALKDLTGTTEDMLDQSITRIETTLRHHKFTLWGLPLVLIGAFIFSAVVMPQRRAIFGGLSQIPWFRTTWLAVWIAALIGLGVFLVVAIRRGASELNRLRAMRDAYRQERDSSAP